MDNEKSIKEMLLEKKSKMPKDGASKFLKLGGSIKGKYTIDTDKICREVRGKR